MPKTSCERVREFRARQRLIRQQSQSQQQQVKKKPKSSCERVREFRARQRLIRQQPQLQQQVKKNPKSVCERVREFRARQRLRQQSQSQQQQVKKKPKSSCERVREFRARQRLIRQQPQLQQQVEKNPKSVCERVREFRARQRLIGQQSHQQQVQKKSKSSTERVRKFRERQKLKQQTEQIQQENFRQDAVRSRSKTGAIRIRDYRQQIKVKCELTGIIKKNCSCRGNSCLNGCAISEEKMDHKKNRTRAVDVRCKEIVANVVKYMEAEKSKNDFLTSVNKVQERAAAATGLSLSTIKRVVAEMKRIESGECSKFREPKVSLQNKNIEINEIHKNILKKIVRYLKEENKPLTLQNIFVMFCKKTGYDGSRENVKKILLDMGFKRKNRKLWVQTEQTGSENQIKEEDYGISFKMEDTSDYDCYDTEVKEEKWNIEDFDKIESTSFPSSRDYHEDDCNQIKEEVKEEPSPSTLNEDIEMRVEENDQNNISSTVKTDHLIENVQLPTSFEQANIPAPLTNCHLPANSILLLVPSVQGTSNTPTLLNLNLLSRANLINTILNPPPQLLPLSLNATTPDLPEQPVDNKE